MIGEKLDLNNLLHSEKNEDVIWSLTGNDFLIEDNIITFTKDGRFILKVECIEDKSENDSIVINVVKWGAEPGIDRRKTRPYQTEILDNWVLITEEACLRWLPEVEKHLLQCVQFVTHYTLKNEKPIIIVPRKILFYQWLNEIKKSFGNDVTVLLFGDNKNDIDQLRIMTYPSDVKVIVLATIQMASKQEFIKTINNGEHLFMLIDEVHNVGSIKYSKVLNILTGPRIGLSATPHRYRDPEGTERILEYFWRKYQSKVYYHGCYKRWIFK